MSSEEEVVKKVLEVEMIDLTITDLAHRFFYRVENCVNWFEDKIAIDLTLETEEDREVYFNAKMTEIALKKYRELSGKQLEEIHITKMKIVKA